MFSTEEIFDTLFDRATGGEGKERLFGPLAEKENRAALHEKLYGLPFSWSYLEFPLAGKAGFDLHICYDYREITRSAPHRDEIHGGRGSLFSWFCSKGRPNSGMGLAYDLREGLDTPPLVYVSTRGDSPEFTEGFFRAAGAPDAAARFRKIQPFLPEGWNFHLGIHLGRRGRPLRIEGSLSDALKESYAENIDAFEKMLASVGFPGPFPRGMRDKISALFGFPFPINVEIDILEDGSFGDVLGVNLVTERIGRNALASSFGSGAVRDAMRLFEEWGIVDDRWKRMTSATFQVRQWLRSCEGKRLPVVLTGRIVFLKVSFRGTSSLPRLGGSPAHGGRAGQSAPAPSKEPSIDAKAYMALHAFYD